MDPASILCDIQKAAENAQKCSLSVAIQHLHADQLHGRGYCNAARGDRGPMVVVIVWVRLVSHTTHAFYQRVFQCGGGETYTRIEDGQDDAFSSCRGSRQRLAVV